MPWSTENNQLKFKNHLKPKKTSFLVGAFHHDIDPAFWTWWSFIDFEDLLQSLFNFEFTFDYLFFFYLNSVKPQVKTPEFIDTEYNPSKISPLVFLISLGTLFQMSGLKYSSEFSI